jgi:Tfp pilus assembly protein PilO
LHDTSQETVQAAHGWTLARLTWQLGGMIDAAGLPGVLALAIALACAAAWVGWITPLADQLDTLRGDKAALEQRARAAPASASAPARADLASLSQRQLDEFNRRFIGEKAIAPTLARLTALAARQGIDLPRGDFQLANEAAGNMARYSMVLPVRGSYRDLRAFADAAMRDIPGLAMQEFSLKRDSAESPEVEARLRLVLFVLRQD